MLVVGAIFEVCDSIALFPKLDGVVRQVQGSNP